MEFKLAPIDSKKSEIADVISKMPEDLRDWKNKRNALERMAV